MLPPNKVSLLAISQSSPVRLRVTDINELPYPGVTVQARTRGGSLNQPSAVSDTNGDVQFQWTQQSDEDQLIASISTGPSLTIYAGVKPIFAPTSILNAASFAPGLVPGGIASIFGVRLGGDNAQVVINGLTADLLFGNDGQLNFVVPSELPVGTAEVMIRAGGAASNTARIPILPTQPGVFFDSATSMGAITVAGTGQVTSVRPVAAGEYVEIYTTGLGAVQTLNSGLRETLIKPQVVIAGVPAEVAFSGLTPGYSGLYQINARIPVGVASGLQTVAITANGVRSNEVKDSNPLTLGLHNHSLPCRQRDHIGSQIARGLIDRPLLAVMPRKRIIIEKHESSRRQTIPEELEGRSFRLGAVHVDVQKRYLLRFNASEDIRYRSLHNLRAGPLGEVGANSIDLRHISSGGNRISSHLLSSALNLFRRVLG